MWMKVHDPRSNVHYLGSSENKAWKIQTYFKEIVSSKIWSSINVCDYVRPLITRKKDDTFCKFTLQKQN